LLLCVLLLWAMFVIGRPDYQPVLGQVQGIAAEAGLARGDRLLAVDGRPTPTWSEAATALVTAAIDRGDVDVRLRSAAGHEATRTLRLSSLPADVEPRRAIPAIGLVPEALVLPPEVGRVREDSAAWGVLAEGDRITAIDGIAVHAFGDIGPLVQALGPRGGGMVEVERDGARLALELVPRLAEAEGRDAFWALGIEPDASHAAVHDATLRHGPLAAVPAALAETGRLARDTVGMVTRMVTGRA